MLVGVLEWESGAGWPGSVEVEVEVEVEDELEAEEEGELEVVPVLALEPVEDLEEEVSVALAPKTWAVISDGDEPEVVEDGLDVKDAKSVAWYRIETP